MFKGQQADISLFLNTVGDACIFNDFGNTKADSAGNRLNLLKSRDVFGNLYHIDAPKWGLEEPTESPAYDTYSITIKSMDDGKIPGIKPMETFAIDGPGIGIIEKPKKDGPSISQTTISQNLTPEIKKLISYVQRGVSYSYSDGKSAEEIDPETGDNTMYKALTSHTAQNDGVYADMAKNLGTAYSAMLRAYTEAKNAEIKQVGLQFLKEEAESKGDIEQSARYDAMIDEAERFINAIAEEYQLTGNTIDKKLEEGGEVTEYFKGSKDTFYSVLGEIDQDVARYVEDMETAGNKRSLARSQPKWDISKLMRPITSDLDMGKTNGNLNSAKGQDIDPNKFMEPMATQYIYRSKSNTGGYDRERTRNESEELGRIEQGITTKDFFYNGIKVAKDSDAERIPVTAMILADNMETRELFGKLLGIPELPRTYEKVKDGKTITGRPTRDQKAAGLAYIDEVSQDTEKHNKVMILSNLDTGEFRVVIELPDGSQKFSPIYKWGSTAINDKEYTMVSENLLTPDGKVAKTPEGKPIQRVYKAETNTPNSRVGGLLIVQPNDGGGYSVVKPNEFGTKPGQVAYTNSDNRPFMHTVMGEGGECVWVSDLTGEPLEIVDYVAPTEFLDDDYQSTIKFSDDTNAVAAIQEQNMDILKLLASSGASPEEVQQNWDSAIQQLGFDPALVGEFTRNDSLGLRWTTRNGHNMQTERTYTDIAMGPEFDENENVWRNVGDVIDNSYNVDRFVPTIRAMANRLLYLWGLGNLPGRGRSDERSSMDLDAIKEILGGKDAYERAKEYGAQTGRNIVGEKVSVWLNDQAELLKRAVQEHYWNKTRFINKKLAKGELTKEEIERPIDPDTGNYVYRPDNHPKFDFDKGEQGSVDAAIGAILSRSDLMDNLDAEEAEDMIAQKLEAMREQLLPQTSESDRFQPMKRNEYLEKYIDAYIEEYNKLTNGDPNAPNKEEAREKALDAAWGTLAGDTPYALNALAKLFGKPRDGEEEGNIEEGDYHFNLIEKGRFNLEVLSQAIDSMLHGTSYDKLSAPERTAVQMLGDKIDETIAGTEEGMNSYGDIARSARNGLDKLMSGRASWDMDPNSTEQGVGALSESEAKGIQTFVSDTNNGEVINILKLMSGVGLLGGTKQTGGTGPGQDLTDLLKGINSIDDLSADSFSKLVDILVERRAIVPMLTPKEFEEEFERFSEKVKNQIGDRGANKPTLHIDETPDPNITYWWKEYEDKETGTIRRKYVGPVTGLSWKASSIQARFRQERFPELIKATGRFRLNHPELYRKLLQQTFDSYRNMDYQELPRNVFLSDEDIRDIKLSKAPPQKNTSQARDQLMEHLYWAATGDSSVYSRVNEERDKNFNTLMFGEMEEGTKITTPERDKTKEEEAAIIKEASRNSKAAKANGKDSYDDLASWIDGESMQLITTVTDKPSRKVVEQILCAPLIYSVAETAKKAMGDIPLTREELDDIDKLIRKNMRGPVDSMYKGKTVQYPKEYVQSFRDRIFDRVIYPLVDRMVEEETPERTKHFNDIISEREQKYRDRFFSRKNVKQWDDLTPAQKKTYNAGINLVRSKASQEASDSYYKILTDRFTDVWSQAENRIKFPSNNILQSQLQNPALLASSEAKIVADYVVPRIETAIVKQREAENGGRLSETELDEINERVDVLRGRIEALCRTSLRNVNHEVNQSEKYYRLA